MKLPEWMKDEFEKGECHHCKKPLTEKGVETHGIKESKSKKTVKYVHFYDYKCPKCRKRAIFSFPTTMKEFIQDMMAIADIEIPDIIGDDSDDTDDLDFEDDGETEVKKSRITDEEVADMKRTLEDSKGLKEFFSKIGIVTDTPITDSDENK